MAQDAKSKDWVQLYEIKDGLEISVVGLETKTGPCGTSTLLGKET